MSEFVLLYGHSYVERIPSYISQNSWVKNLDMDLGLGETSAVIFDGVGGRSVYDLIADVDRIISNRPHTVVLLIGCNDFGLPGSDGRVIARDLLAASIRLHNSAGIRVMICRAMPRYRMPKIVGRLHQIAEDSYLDKYERDFFDFNVYLGTYAWQYGIGYWDYNGKFSKAGVWSKFATDGIHLNDDGQYMLYRSLRGAVLSARNL